VNKFYVADANRPSRYWPILILLFLGAIVAWWKVSSSLAAVMAAAGFLFMFIEDKRAKNKTGDSLEILDRCIIICEGGNSSSIAFSDIKKVKYSKALTSDSPTIVIETSLNKKSINPSDYDNSGRLLQQLENKFAAYKCQVIK
jgi:hypothetical protein